MAPKVWVITFLGPDYLAINFSRAECQQMVLQLLKKTYLNQIRAVHIRKKWFMSVLENGTRHSFSEF